MAVTDDIKFSMQEIADACGVEIDFGGGISYGVLGVHIPLKGRNRFLHLRQGDEETDRECKVVNKYLPV